MDEPNWTGVFLVSGVFGGVILVCVGQIVVMYRYARKGIRVTGVVEQVHAHRGGVIGDTRMGGPAGTRYSATVRYEVGSTCCDGRLLLALSESRAFRMPCVSFGQPTMPSKTRPNDV